MSPPGTVTTSRKSDGSLPQGQQELDGSIRNRTEEPPAKEPLDAPPVTTVAPRNPTSNNAKPRRIQKFKEKVKALLTRRFTGRSRAARDDTARIEQGLRNVDDSFEDANYPPDEVSSNHGEPTQGRQGGTESGEAEDGYNPRRTTSKVSWGKTVKYNPSIGPEANVLHST